MALAARYAALSGYLDVARALDLDPIRLMAQVDLDPGGLARPDTWIPAARISRLLELSARESGCPDFGLRLAEHRALSALGPVGLVLRDEPTLRSALEMLIRYEHSYNESLRLRLSETNGLVTMSMWFEFGEPVASRQALELAAAAVHGVCRQFLGTEWQPLSTCFTHQPPPDLDYHTRLLGQRLHFEHDFNGIIVYSQDLDTSNEALPSRRTDPEALLSSLGGQHGETTAAHVTRLVELLIPAGRCSADQVAQTLGVDRRTLHRHLSQTGDTFSSVVDSTRAGLAERYLASERYRLTEISEMLGFSAPSAFTRWFRQRFGVSPSEWRLRGTQSL